MASPKFSIGIDLGTTNCAMAFEGFALADRRQEVFPISQWETTSRFSEASTLPSFLYLLSEDEAMRMSSQHAPRAEWVPGRFARTRAAESPGRVVHSAKSWLCHHGVDRNASFLPWRSDEIPVEKRISPIRASALLLQYLRAAWDTKLAGEGLRFDDQEITITVPASFDAAAQRLTLDAAREAGFPEGIRLLEEPQAAFYWWLERGTGPSEDAALTALSTWNVQHVLVVDIGGGTTDLTLFEIAPRSGNSLAGIKRIAVSDHLLLGGDNIDLAIAHRVEARLPAHEPLSEVQWNFLVARCRDIKERCLSDSSSQIFTLSIPGRGSNLLKSTLGAQIEREEIESIVLDGFFPECTSEAQPLRTQAGLREWALPYAVDSAVTRYLAEFLRGRPRVDAILFNGGSLYPQILRERLQKQITQWQGGDPPRILENLEPSLAVARGAAHFGSIVHHRAQRIEAGAARSIYLEVHQKKDGQDTTPFLICLLPSGAPSEETFQVAPEGLELRINRPVRFQPFYSTRRSRDQAGSIVRWNDRDFQRLPPFQTTAKLAVVDHEGDRLPVALAAHLNDLGLLRVACVSTNPDAPGTWPLEFDLRPHESSGSNSPARDDDETVELDPGVEPKRLESARLRITTIFSRPLDRRDKISSAQLLKSLEQILEKQKSDWTSPLIRALWSSLDESFSHRQQSVEHEETWLILAGYFLRPGFGAPGDGARIDQLWRLHTEGLKYQGKRNQLQMYILWRRVAGGLSPERQEIILAPELPKLRAQTQPPAELIRLAGSLERIDLATKTNLLKQFLPAAHDLAAKKQHAGPHLVALGLLLNRGLFYAGPEFIMPPAEVEKAYDALSDLDWAEPHLVDIQTLFLRAGRIVNDAKIDLPKSLRERIASKLQKAGVAPSKLARLRSYVPIGVADRASLFGESLPPGLLIS
jgi:molecular chaperone DnaK (HSP70)